MLAPAPGPPHEAVLRSLMLLALLMLEQREDSEQKMRFKVGQEELSVKMDVFQDRCGGVSLTGPCRQDKRASVILA